MYRLGEWYYFKENLDHRAKLLGLGWADLGEGMCSVVIVSHGGLASLSVETCEDWKSDFLPENAIDWEKEREQASSVYQPLPSADEETQQKC